VSAHPQRQTVVTDASLDTEHHPDFLPEGKDSSSTQWYTAMFSNTLRDLTCVTWRTERYTHANFAVIKAGAETRAPVTVSSGNDGTSSTAAGNLLSHNSCSRSHRDGSICK